MAYDLIETSQEDGRPVYLYRFILGESTWRYTSADEDVVTPGDVVWQAVPISDDGITQSGEASSDAMRITADSSIGPAVAYRGSPPSNTIQLVVFRTHEGDFSDIVVAYAGEISEINYPTPSSVIITCEALSATMRRSGLRLGWQRTCPYALYDPMTCKVNLGLYGISGTIDDITGFTITVDALAAQPDGKFTGGFIQWDDPVRGTERRMIESQDNGDLVMFGTTTDLTVGTPILAFPGCARTMAACGDFNNLPNYGGFPHMPGKSPFDGDPVFY